MTTPWYRDGLNFRCDGPRCTDCCSGKWGPGLVRLDQGDLQALADHLQCDLATFVSLNTRRVPEGIALRERHNHDCIFHEPDFGCRVYEARPKQCRGYPFWPRVLRSKESWEEEGLRCPGIDAEGAERVPLRTIDLQREQHAPPEGTR